MSYFGKVQKSIDYIEEHLRDDLNLVRVAKVVAFSPYHFHGIFSSVVGETFKDYIRKRRLTEAAHTLKNTDNRIIDIALDFHFESQESFTRAFKKMFKLNPGAYRKAHRVPLFYEKKKLSLRELEHRMKGIKLKNKMVKLEEFFLVGFEYLGSSNHKNEIPELWQKLHKQMENIDGRMDPRPEHGVGYCFATAEMMKKDEMRYVAGVKVHSIKKIPKQMVGIKVPGQTYAVFTHTGPIEKIKTSFEYIYGAWLPKSGLEPADGADLEIYDERFKYGDESSEFDIYVPVKELNS